VKSRLVVIGLLLMAAVSAQAQLVNPSFENKGPQDDQAEGWLRWGDWMNRESAWTPVKDGVCIIGYHHWQIEKSDNSGLYQDMKVEAGKNFTFSIYANADKTTDNTKVAESVELRLETTVNGTQATVASKMYNVADIASGTDWSKLQVSGVAPNESLRALIVVNPAKEGPRGGALKLDAASLSEGQ
jgi:hypothetical protein